METYAELMEQDYIGRFMEEGDRVPSLQDIESLAFELLSNPLEYDFTADDIIKRCVEVFNMDQESVEIAVSIAGARER